MLVATLCAWNLLQLIDNTLALPRPALSFQYFESRAASITVPSCAASCVQTLIQQSFPTCANEQDLSCLCTDRSLTGYTIGEDILQCVISNCPNATSDQLSQAYSICNSIPNAVQPTHATITANIATETTIFAEPSSTSASSAAAAAGTTSTNPILTTSAAPSSSSSSSLTAQATSTTPTTSSTAPATTLTTKTGPPRSAIIGISVGLGILALIAMALLSYICCCCKRHNHRESAQSYETTKQPLISEKKVSSAPSLAPPSRTNPYMPSKAQSFLGQKYSGWSPISTSNQATSPYQTLAATPRDERSITPVSAATYQTTSRLLPEKPLLQSPPRPARDKAEGTPLMSPSATQALAARTRASPSHPGASPDSFDSGRILHKKPSDPFLQVPDPHYKSTQTTAENRETTRANLPKLNTKSVQFTSQPLAQSTTPQQRRPSATHDPASYVHGAETQTPNWRTPAPAQTRNTSIIQPGLALIKETTEPIKRRPVSTSRPIETAFNKYRPIPTTKVRRAASTVTSFESDGDSIATASVPPLVIWKKPVPAPTVQGSGQQTRQQYHPTAQQQSGKQLLSTTPATPLSHVKYPAVPTITMTPVSSTEKPQILLSAFQENTARPNQPYEPYGAHFSPVDTSRLPDGGLVELPDSVWVPVKLVATPSLQASNFASNATTYRKPLIHQNGSTSQPRPSASASSTYQPAPKMIVELSSDAERLADPTARVSEQSPSASRSPKSDSRGARLGAAVAEKTPQARRRGNSESNARILLPAAPRMGHMRSQSHAVDSKPLPSKIYRPLEDIGLEPAARRQIHYRPGVLY